MSSMSDSPIDRVRRIVAAVPPAGDAATLLRLAAQAARLWHAELSAVLVEDSDLVQLAGLSVARHYVSATARPAPLTPEMLRLAQVVARRRAEALLGQLLASTPVTWQLRAAGELAGGPPLAEDDLLLVCPRAMQAGDWLQGALDSAVSVAALLLEGPGRSLQHLAVLDDGTLAGQRARTLGAQLAASGGASCLVLADAQGSSAGVREPPAARDEPGPRLSIETLPGLDPAAVAAMLRRTRAGMVLLPAAAGTICGLQQRLAADRV